METHGTQGYERDRPVLEPLLTIPAVCDVLAVSRQTVWRLVRRGELTPTRVGDRPRFAPADVRAYLERQREPVAAP